MIGLVAGLLYAHGRQKWRTRGNLDAQAAWRQQVQLAAKRERAHQGQSIVQQNRPF